MTQPPSPPRADHANRQDCQERSIAIVGAGFCGTMMAVHLLSANLHTHGALRIVLINRPEPADTSAANTKPAALESSVLTGALGRGLAYGTDSAEHLLNVPAARMSVWPSSANLPDDFVRYLHTQNQSVSGADFVPRHWYGKYLRACLDGAANNSPHRLVLRHDTVLDIAIRAESGNTTDGANVTTPAAAESQYRLSLACGQPLDADAVVLALGNFAPATPRALRPLAQASARYIADPWRRNALAYVNITKPILLVGTGLTMFDVALSLKRRADAAQTNVRMLAISRRGLLPQPHRPHSATPNFASISKLTSPTARSYLRELRRLIDAGQHGDDWRDVLAAMRPATAALWQALPTGERARFLRHLKPYWESHRHRAAPTVSHAINELRASGSLHTMAASLVGVEVNKTSEDIGVSLRQRGQSTPVVHEFGSIINCTGPSADMYAEPLLTALEARGELMQDALRLGLQVDADYRLHAAPTEAPVDAPSHTPAPRARQNIFYVGPLLRARDWEATAVPELREHVAMCAASVLAGLAAKS
jgi:uncharacterized NAD(P)/FAD-binding protein YdhS